MLPSFKLSVRTLRLATLLLASTAIVLAPPARAQDAAPHRMGELAETDGGAVAVAGNAEIDQVAVGEIGPGQH